MEEEDNVILMEKIIENMEEWWGEKKWGRGNSKEIKQSLMGKERQKRISNCQWGKRISRWTQEKMVGEWKMADKR